MKFRKLTHNDAGEEVAPRSPDDGERWDEWVSATKTRGYRLGNTLGDWLHLYGEEHGFEKDPTPDERLDFRRFNMKQGIAFEERVAGYLAQRAELTRITADGLESRSLEKAKATLAALEAGCEIVHGGVLWNPENRTYGVPDFLIRSDVFDRLFPHHPDPYGGVAADQADAEARGGWRYVVVDAKFTTLHLFAEKARKGSRPGEINNDGSSPAYRAQLFLYNAAPRPPSGVCPTPGFPAGPRLGTEQGARFQRRGPAWSGLHGGGACGNHPGGGSLDSSAAEGRLQLAHPARAQPARTPPAGVKRRRLAVEGSDLGDHREARRSDPALAGRGSEARQSRHRGHHLLARPTGHGGFSGCAWRDDRADA